MAEHDNGEHEQHDHSDHHKHMAQDFRKRFYISLVLTMPVLALSPLIQQFLNLEFSFAGDSYVLFAFSTALFFYGGWPFLKGIYSELKEWSPGMMTLIALAISVAYFYSSAVVFGLEGRYFFWELATLIDVMLLGHWLEMKSVIGASKALEKLAELMPDTARRINGDDTEEVKISELKKGDLVLVKAGEKMPADGVIKKGNSNIDESMLTGESKPVEKKKGDKLIGGSVNGDSVLEIEITETGEDSYLNKVIGMVKDAQQAKSKTQRLADTAAKWLTVIAVTAGVSTFAYWFIYGPDLAFSIERMATVMVITCPHALGLAIPLVNAVSTSLSAKNGLLIRNRTAFEGSRKISTVVFDKTGTLTEGTFAVSSITSHSDYSDKKLMGIAAAMEQNSEHPIAEAIIRKAKGMKAKKAKATDFKILKGEGIQAKIGNKTVKMVSSSHLEKNDIDIPETEEVGTIVHMLEGKKVVGTIVLSDKIREESADAIKELKDAGIKCMMLTGDNEKAAKQVSEKLGLDGYFAEVLPDQKQEKIKELQEKGEVVAMTGDGINDAPALAQANVGIAIGSGTDVAAETADIILVNSNPKDVSSLIMFGKATHKKMIQNLFWATGYNVIAIPLAAGVLYGYGILISPAIGAALMSLSTVIVAVNARLLKF